MGYLILDTIVTFPLKILFNQASQFQIYLEIVVQNIPKNMHVLEGSKSIAITAHPPTDSKINEVSG